MCIIFALNCAATDSAVCQDNECDFDLSTVLVVIKKEYSEFGKEYSPEEFDADLIESVEVINQIEKDQTDLSGYNLEYWQHILSLKLKEPSKENVEAVIEAAYKNEQVESAEKNYILTVDLGFKSDGNDINLNEDHLFDYQTAKADARLAERCAAQLETLTQKQLVMADVNYDGKITSEDARTILRLSAGLIEPLVSEGD